MRVTEQAGMKTHHVGIAMNGVTGRMGANQHLARSIAAIIKQGGVRLSASERVMPEPVLVGRNEAKLRAVAGANGGLPICTDMEKVLADPAIDIFFDASLTQLHHGNLERAIKAGKHIYSEKPVCVTVDEALALEKLADAKGVKHGVVADKLWLPGLLKLKHLIDTGYFGEILSVKGDFGYWVFTGIDRPAQRPSWNYKKAEGGSIILDMFCHWRYVIDNLFGNVRSVMCLGQVAIHKRRDENGVVYDADADDAAYAIMETERGIICQFNSSWCTRVRRDDLLTIQVDGTRGSAVAGLRGCVTQHDANTPKPVWNPDIEQPIKFLDGWSTFPDNQPYDNAFKVQWELFLKAVVRDEPFPWNLREGAKGVQLAQLALDSWARRAFVEVPAL